MTSLLTDDVLGAPEMSRMNSNGTFSGVTQSIDTWSFGCVLSVAATWIVLGFQGIRQYEKLRALAPSNDGKFDRFHNGTDVLPEVKKWHNYLRGHLRSSDTTTSLVLDLVEHKMLQTETHNRISLGSLCDELNELIVRAENKIEQLKDVHSRFTDPAVLQALLQLEEKAQQQRRSRPKSTPLQQQTALRSLDVPHPLQRAAMHVKKHQIIREKPLGQTNHRKEILKSELHRDFAQDTESSSSGKHEGAVTDSPTGTYALPDLFPFERHEKPRHPEFSSTLTKDSHAHHSAQDTGSLRGHSVHQGGILNGDKFVGVNHHVQFSSSEHVQVPSNLDRSTRYSQRPTVSIPDQQSSQPLTSQQFVQIQPFDESRGAFTPVLLTSSPGSHTATTSSPLSPNSTEQAYLNESADRAFSWSPSRVQTAQTARQSGRSFSPPIYATLQQPQLEARDDEEHGYLHPSGSPASLGPAIKITNPIDHDTASTPRETMYGGTHLAEKQVAPESLHHEVAQPTPLPPSVNLLPFEICLARPELKESNSKSLRNRVKKGLGRETMKADPKFTGTFKDRRELVSATYSGRSRSLTILGFCRGQRRNHV